jgi:hypothetical protein
MTEDLLSPTVATALLAGLLEELCEDLTDQLAARPEPERLNYGVLADMVAARIEPRLAALEHRVRGMAADMALIKTRAKRWR